MPPVRSYAGQDKDGNFQTLGSIATNMRLAATVDEQLTCSLGLPCTFDKDTQRYYLSSTAAQALQAAHDAANAPPLKLISAEELAERLKRIKDEKKSK